MGMISLNGYTYGGGTDKVTDVRVDGESVVHRKVADIDLSPYAKKSAMQDALNTKQDKLIAGANISIGSDGKTISATDTKYIAGENINISVQNEISAIDTKYPFAVANGKLCIVYDDGN